jgi:hypothetical protein
VVVLVGVPASFEPLPLDEPVVDEPLLLVVALSSPPTEPELVPSSELAPLLDERSPLGPPKPPELPPLLHAAKAPVTSAADIHDHVFIGPPLVGVHWRYLHFGHQPEHAVCRTKVPL